MSATNKVRSDDLNFAKADKKISSLEFRVLKTFAVVAESSSFHEAALKLDTTQARVSQRIKQLEELLNKRLLNRDLRGRRLNALTPQGQEFLIHARRLIRMVREVEDMFLDPSTVRGIVRVGVSESIVHTWLPTLLKRVNATYPNLDLEIEVDISPKLQSVLAVGALDLAFVLGPLDPDLRSRPLCRFPVAFVASKEVVPHNSITLEEIVNAKHRIITFSQNTQPHQVVRDLLRDRGLHATIWASASVEAIVRLALED